MKVSVIIPLHNQEQYIEETIRSVMSQTFKDFELIVINDESTDGSMDKVWDLMENQGYKIRTKHHEKNLGIGATRNTGVEMAEGELIAFLSADDVWKYDFLEQMVKNYTDGIAFCNYTVINAEGQHLRKFCAFPEHEKPTTFDSKKFKKDVHAIAKNHGMFVNYSCVLGKKKYFKFENSLRFGEDFHHLLKNCGSVPFTYVPGYHVAYRWHQNNTTNQKMSEIKDNNKRIFEMLKK